MRHEIRHRQLRFAHLIAQGRNLRGLDRWRVVAKRLPHIGQHCRDLLIPLICHRRHAAGNVVLTTLDRDRPTQAAKLNANEILRRTHHPLGARQRRRGRSPLALLAMTCNAHHKLNLALFHHRRIHSVGTRRAERKNQRDEGMFHDLEKSVDHPNAPRIFHIAITVAKINTIAASTPAIQSLHVGSGRAADADFGNTINA